MRPLLPRVSRRATLLAFAALVGTVAGACSSPLFPPSDSPSVGLTSTATSSIALGTVVTFNVTASSPGNPANISMKNIHLEFGDGQSVELGAAPAPVAHLYSVAGTFTASATATNTVGNRGTASLTIVVSAPPKPPPPSVGLSSTATNPTPAGTVVTFTVTASIPGNPANDFIQSIRLDFGDGESADLGTTPGAVPHLYPTAGTFTATATATDTNGGQGKASITIVVGAPSKLPTPSVGLTSNATNPTAVGTVVTFTVTASIPGNPANDFIQSIRLDFGDGQSADLGATATGGVLHSYATAGTYAATATATDTNGSVAKASLTIIVK